MENGRDKFYEGAFARTRLVMGAEALERLKNAAVLVCGIGGVGSHAAEALARAGVGRIILADSDIIAESNLNRQIHADTGSIGLLKTEAMRSRVLSVNPFCEAEARTVFISAETIPGLAEGCDFVIDAIDTVASKLALIEHCSAKGLGIISCMGTGNKIFPELLEITDIYKTSVCPLAKVMRGELRKLGIERLTVCYSPENPRKSGGEAPPEPGGLLRPKRQTVGSVSFVPPVAGFLMAGHVIREIAGPL